jgi:hypothetical protein
VGDRADQAALLLRKRGPAAQALLDEGPLAADPAEAAAARADLAAAAAAAAGRVPHPDPGPRPAADLGH